MASAAIWLEELGIPPREVCLDWAWQLQTRFAETPPSISREAEALSWQRIEVSDAGELSIPQGIQNYSATARVRELLSWAQGGEQRTTRVQHPSSHELDLESELHKLTAQCIAAFSEVSLPTEQNTTSENATLQTSCVAESEPMILPVKLIRSQTSRSSSKLVGQAIAVLKEHWLVTSLVSAVCVLACVFALSSGTGKVHSNPTPPSRETGESRGDEVADKILEQDDSAALATLTEIPQLEVSQPQPKDVSTITMPSVSSAAIVGQYRSDADRPAAVQASIDATTELSTTELMPQTVDSVSAGKAPETAMKPELPEGDVMQELETLTKSAANNAVETDLEVQDAKEASDVPEPFVLNTFPMVQTLKLAAKIKVRPRQPVWKIRLSVDDEFELAPLEPQDISDKQPTTWMLSDSDSKSPKVRLVIQAQAVPGRQTALRWRIFAGAEDLTDLMLPLDKEILIPLQDRLRFYTQATQREAERLKQVASGAERDVRVTLSKQRVFMEAQSKLASRISTIVAETQLLDGLLRSHVTVHAILRDGTASDAQALLQFGDPTKLEKVQEISQPSEVAE